VGEGMATVEGLQYRPHIVSSVYHITEKAREYIGYVADKYDVNEMQQMLKFEEVEVETITLIDTIRQEVK